MKYNDTYLGIHLNMQSLEWQPKDGMIDVRWDALLTNHPM
jgi:hypothetical protein